MENFMYAKTPSIPHEHWDSRYFAVHTPMEKFVLMAWKLHVFFLIFGDFTSFSSSILSPDSRLLTIIVIVESEP